MQKYDLLEFWEKKQIADNSLIIKKQQNKKPLVWE